MGIFATGQTYEQLILHLLAHPLPEARDYGRMILDAVKAVMPSFVARVERPDRGGEWVGYLRDARGRRERWAARLGLDRERRRRRDRPVGAAAARRRRRGRTCWPRCCSRRPACSEERTRATRSRGWAPSERARAAADLVGARANRRHRPGRGFEALRYRFEIVSDYGAFRDLQRHRMLTVPVAGADARPRRRRAGGGRRGRRAATPTARALERLARRSTSGSPPPACASAAPYALCLGYRIRYVLDLNAREAMQLIELRSGREGHPSYRAVAHEMHAQIAARPPRRRGDDDARRHASTEPRLERILCEMRTQAKLDALQR